MRVWTEWGLKLLAAFCVSGDGDQCCDASPSGMPAASLSVCPQVYVLKRPYVDEFLRRMGELFECVLFTASLAKVPGGWRGDKNWEQVWPLQGVLLAGPRDATREPGLHPNKSIFSSLSMPTL